MQCVCTILPTAADWYQQMKKMGACVFSFFADLNELISEDSPKYELRSRSPRGRSRSATRSMEALTLAGSRHGGSTPTLQTRWEETGSYILYAHCIAVVV